MSTDLARQTKSKFKKKAYMQYFDESGRRVPRDGLRVFSSGASTYYRLTQPSMDYGLILDRITRHQTIPLNISASEFKARADSLLDQLKLDSGYSNMTNGVFVPFVCRRAPKDADLGSELQSRLLPALHRAFNERYPDAHFKAVLQGNSKLNGQISLDLHSKYDEFITACEQESVVGLYFPQALQGFDVNSQQLQMHLLPASSTVKVCLSGGLDICTALTGVPELLISGEFYTPIPIMSAYRHNDDRLVLLLKAYGPHMEFWCMTKMLTKTTTQVSEQWTGGITVYEKDAFKSE